MKPFETSLESNDSLNSEGRLLERAVAGDPQAFALLSDLHRPGLTQLAKRYLKDRDDANDVVQETLYKAYRSIADFRLGRPFRPWLFRICSNCCIDAMRLKRREPAGLEVQDSVPTDSPPIEDQVGGALIRNQILDAIARLPHKYRQIVLMRHIRHMEVSEIAYALNTPEGTIKSWLFRARALLKKDLRPVFG